MLLKKEKTLKIISIILFTLYIGLLIWIVMLKCNLINSIHLSYDYLKDMTIKERLNVFNIPFKNYFPESIDAPEYLFNSDDLLNIIIFIPLGLYITYFSKKFKFIKVFILTLLISLFFELFQLFSLIGSFAVQDFITNITGGLIGYIVYKLIFIKGLQPKKILILNILSILLIILLIPILLYAIKNTISNIDIYLDIIKSL